MSSIPWLEDLEYLSTFERVFLVLIVIIGSMATGFALDAPRSQAGLAARDIGGSAACSQLWARAAPARVVDEMRPF
jgi:hypothetical protein